MHAPALRELRDALELATPGAIPSGASILPFLTRAWSYLHGASAGGMTREKLAGHVTNVHWSPPVLSFELDGDAARETWQVDLQDGTAWLSARERRELPPKEDAADLALALAKRIVAGRGSLAGDPQARRQSLRPSRRRARPRCGLRRDLSPGVTGASARPSSAQWRTRGSRKSALTAFAGTHDEEYAGVGRPPLHPGNATR